MLLLIFALYIHILFVDICGTVHQHTSVCSWCETWTKARQSQKHVADKWQKIVSIFKKLLSMETSAISSRCAELMPQVCISIIWNTPCIFQFSILIFVCHQGKTRPAMCNNEAHSSNHIFTGKALSITYSDCVFVAVGIHHAMRISHIVICDLSGSTIFFFVIS